MIQFANKEILHKLITWKNSIKKSLKSYILVENNQPITQKKKTLTEFLKLNGRVLNTLNRSI